MAKFWCVLPVHDDLSGFAIQGTELRISIIALGAEKPYHGTYSPDRGGLLVNWVENKTRLGPCPDAININCKSHATKHSLSIRLSL